MSNSSKVADYAKSLESLTLAAVKLKDAGVLSKESVQKVAGLVDKFIGKIETEIDSLDFTAPVIEPVTAPIAPVIQQVATPPITNPNVSPSGERLYAGKTLKELNQMNSAPLFKLAGEISKYPNVNPNVPLQQQKFENDWRMDLISYITSNAQFAE